ncbi:MAG: hypothetical protein QXY50_00205 [Candidatus Caldarchaeum sp.]
MLSSVSSGVLPTLTSPFSRNALKPPNFTEDFRSVFPADGYADGAA